ncbi:hypothetical protein EDD94_7954 [Streptomyces sp. PanSC9]|nr:hypothetical protein EDD94_7954 [Streptomyces sp. PanSC9]
MASLVHLHIEAQHKPTSIQLSHRTDVQTEK